MAAPSLRKRGARPEGESVNHAAVAATAQRAPRTAACRAELHARLRPPPLPISTVERRRQLAFLDHALGKKLTLMVAPAGSGKTSLLTQWTNALAATTPVAWLTVHPSDDAPEALRRSLRVSIDQAAHRIERPTQSLVVVLDDAHRIQDTQSAGALLTLILDSPPNYHFIVCGSGVPDLHASSFLVRDELLRIDASHLNADPEFIARVAHKLGRALTPDTAASLHERTEGWLAGVKFSLLAQESATQAFFAELWTALPDDLRRLLLACSIVERITGEIIDVLLGTASARALLENSERRQLFVYRDDSADSYRLHRLFAEFLRHTAQRDCPSQFAAWQVCASRWYAKQQQYERALHHASLGDDREWRLDLVACAARAFVKSGAIDAALKSTAALDSHDLFSREALWTAHITTLILTKRFPAAHVVLSNAVDRYAAHTLSGRSLDIKLRTLRTMLDMLAGRAGDSALELPADAEAGPYLTGTLLSLQAYRLFHLQHFDAARRRATQARDILLDLGSEYGATHANAIVCATLGATAQYDAAVEECERLFKLMSSRQRTAAWANAAAALAQVRYEQNRLAEAESLCTEALSMLNSASTAQSFAACHFVLARTHDARDKFATAWRLLDLVHGHAEIGPQPLLLSQVCYEKLRICLRHNRRAEADAIATEFDLDRHEKEHAWTTASNSPLDGAVARLGCAQALRLFYAREFERCLALAQALFHDAKRKGFTQRAIALQALIAGCHAQAEDPLRAFEALNQALSLAGAHAFTRGVFDESPKLAALVAHATDSGQLLTSLPPRYVEKFSDLFAPLRVSRLSHPNTLNSSMFNSNRLHSTPLNSARGAPRRSASALPVLLEPLTDRETALLRLLAQGLSNQEICARSNIALTTTKWHLKNIFSKLAVNTRTAALARARTLQLIE